jgi:enoyl-CoA hydratase
LRIGVQRALDLILTGRTFTAAEGLSLGLVSRVIPADDFDAGVDVFVADLASLSGPVLKLAKRAALVPGRTDMGRFEAAELLYAEELVQLADATEGLTAFLEKRPPVWKGA